MTDPPRATPPAAAVPPAVRTASMLLWVLVALMAVRTLVTIVLLDDLVDAYAESLRGGAALPRDVVADGAPAYVPVALFSLFVFGGLLGLCAAFVKRGAAWARIVATMFASLAALGGLLVLLQPSTVLFTLLGVLSAAVAVAAVVLLFSGPAKAFFRAQRRRTSSGHPMP